MVSKSVNDDDFARIGAVSAINYCGVFFRERQKVPKNVTNN